MKVLVIGGTRLAGKILVKKLLENDFDVTIVTRGKTKDSFGRKVKRVFLDVMDSENIKHSLPRDGYDLVYDMLVLSPNHIRERLSVLNCEKYVMISSAGVYHSKYHLEILEEEYDAVAEEWSYCGYEGIDYDTRKKYAESALVTDFHRIPSIRVRFPVIFSAGEYTGRFEWYIDHIMHNKPVNINNLKDKHAYISHEDAGNFLFHLSGTQMDIENAFWKRMAVNAAGEGVISQYDIWRMISDFLQKEKRQQILRYSENGDVSPFNSVNEYSLDTNLAKSLGGGIFSDNLMKMKSALQDMILIHNSCHKNKVDDC